MKGESAPCEHSPLWRFQEACQGSVEWWSEVSNRGGPPFSWVLVGGPVCSAHSVWLNHHCICAKEKGFITDPHGMWILLEINVLRTGHRGEMPFRLTHADCLI